MTGRRPLVHHEEQRRTLERFVAERGDRLLRTAALLAGSRADGEDLLQSALERLLRNWRRIDGDPESYVRRTLYNLAADGWRRQAVCGSASRYCSSPRRRPTRPLLLIFVMPWSVCWYSFRRASGRSWCCATSSS
jgi:Sigma-70 region 2